MHPKRVVLAVIIVLLVLLGGTYIYFHETRTARAYAAQLTACRSLPNDSVQQETETDRLFINLPKALYAAENMSPYFHTVSGNATAGWISNGGKPGQGLQATPKCWSTYYEFDGTGEVDLRVPGMSGAPDYSVRFMVGSAAHGQR